MIIYMGVTSTGSRVGYGIVNGFSLFLAIMSALTNKDITIFPVLLLIIGCIFILPSIGLWIKSETEPDNDPDKAEAINVYKAFTIANIVAITIGCIYFLLKKFYYKT